MHLGGRIQAAIEVLQEVENKHRPAGDALRDWGRAHRFAGSGDRAVIGNLVFDALRKRRSLAQLMADDGARAAILAVVAREWAVTVETLEAACADPHGPDNLSADERDRLSGESNAPTAGSPMLDIPEWLSAQFGQVFGDDLQVECAALGDRPPIDLRVNSLKSTREKVLKALSRFGAKACLTSPVGVRVDAPADADRYPNLEAEAAHGKGWFETQDEGSQIAALLATAKPGEQVLDLCAGAGGKTLALAGAMRNKGQIYAYDKDRTRLRRIFERLKRAGVRNSQVIEAADEKALSNLDNRMDLVFVDAPCSGSGTWRRRPDAKWRLSSAALERRLEEQRDVLALAAGKVRPGGRLVYVTCSLLPQENGKQVQTFLADHADFTPLAVTDLWTKSFDAAVPRSSNGADNGIVLTPHANSTDGFYVAVMERR